MHFKDISSRMSLKDLVGIFWKHQGFSLHCADEDSRALKQVFMNLHHMRGVDRSTFERNLGKMRRIYMKSITVPKSCKEIKELANKHWLPVRASPKYLQCLQHLLLLAFILRPGGS